MDKMVIKEIYICAIYNLGYVTAKRMATRERESEDERESEMHRKRDRREGREKRK